MYGIIFLYVSISRAYIHLTHRASKKWIKINLKVFSEIRANIGTERIERRFFFAPSKYEKKITSMKPLVLIGLVKN